MKRVVWVLVVSLSAVGGGLFAQERAREARPSQSAVAQALLSDDWQVSVSAWKAPPIRAFSLSRAVWNAVNLCRFASTST